MVVKSNGNGEFILRKWHFIIIFILLLLTTGYSFAVTFYINPLREEVKLLRSDVSKNSQFRSEMNIHIDYIKSELSKINNKLDNMK